MLVITLLHVGIGLQVTDRDRELIAREPRERHGHRAVAFELEERAEARGDGLQQRVARTVADAVVDALEVVDVDAHHREALAGGRGFAARLFEQLQQVLAVRQLRQRIEERQLADAIGGAVPFGHVAQHQQQAALVVGHDARFEAPFDAVAHAFEFDFGAVVAHAAVVERVRDRARRVAAHELGDLLLGLHAAVEEGMIFAAPSRSTMRSYSVDDEQQVGQGVEHRALPALALFELLHQPAAANQILHAVAQQVPVDGLREEVRRAGLVGLVDRGDVVAAGDHHDRQVRAARARADFLARLVAVHLRHLDVHEHGVAFAGFDGRHRGGSVGRLGNQEATALERAAHEQARAGVVVDDQYVDGFWR